MTENIRTRFAPSPTGYLHVGGIRTALFAWLVARQVGGQFILRIEDTDKNREVSGSAKHIQESLRWLGIDWDEGVSVGGEYGPYIQSERLAIYKAWAKKLVDNGRAYADPHTPQEVQAFREAAAKEKRPFLYRSHRPENPPVWDGSQPLRFRSEPKAYQWYDEVMGDLSTGPEVIDDFILIKSDGYPTYNFCHIIDDYLMKITHVIRSQEFIASVPNYLNLYEALEIRQPKLATVPFVMGIDGKKKLGKRDGAKDVLDYRKEGYVPDALVSFMATLGWNDSTTQEVFTREELIKKFSLDRVGKSGAQFDERRLLWTNGHFIRKLSLNELYKQVTDFWPPEATSTSDKYKKAVLGLIQERLKYFAELPKLTSFFFTDLPVNPELISDNKQLKKLSTDEMKSLLEATRTTITESDFSISDLQKRLNQLLEITRQKPGVLFSLVRITTTWAPASPELAKTLSVLGKERVLQRLQAGINFLNG